MPPPLARRVSPFLRVGALFALALAVRLAYIGWLAPPYHLDPGEMERAAANFAREGRFANVFADDSGPSAHVGPVYPAVLAAIHTALGPDRGRIGQKVFAALASAMAVAVLPLLAGRLGLRPAAGWAAGLCLAVSPLYWFDETSGSWEQPVSAVILLATVWWTAGLHEGWRVVSLLGAAAGLLVLLTPALLPAVGLMMAAAVAARPGRRLAVAGRAAAALGIAAAVVAPWAARNYAIWGGFLPLRSNFGLELRIGNNPAATGKSAITFWHDPASPFNDLHPLRSPAERERLRAVGEPEYMREHGRLARAWMRENPGRVAELTARRVVLFWFAPPDLFEPGTSFVAARTALFSLATLGAVLGLVELARRRHPAAGLLAGAIVGGSLAYAVTHVDPRYRYPTFGLAVLAGCEFAATRAGRRPAGGLI